MTWAELAADIVRPKHYTVQWREETPEEAQNRRERNELIYRQYIKRMFAEKEQR